MGGMEQHILLLGQGLVQRGFQVAAICSRRDEIEPLRQGLVAAGVQVHALAERQGSPLSAIGRLRALVATLRRYPRCIFHLHCTGPAAGELVMLSGHLAGARAVLRTEHLPPVPPCTTRERVLVQLRDHALARVICVSEQTRREHLERLGRKPEKCVVVPNCVDLERFSPRVRADAVYAEFGLDPAAPIVGTVSRLGEHRKGMSYFLQMAAIVAEAYPAARFLIVGDGSLRPALEQEAAALGIARNVIFTGERQDVPRLIAAMQVFVMPSLWEGGPYTVIEAMAMAKPVVATPVGLVPDAVEDHVTGLLAPIADSGALARGVLELLGNQDLAYRLAQSGRERVTAHFSLDAMVDGVVHVYRDVA
jgi:glycosyltransferase involved in cell wall biosynthesis